MGIPYNQPMEVKLPNGPDIGKQDKALLQIPIESLKSYRDTCLIASIPVKKSFYQNIYQITILSLKVVMPAFTFIM